MAPNTDRSYRDYPPINKSLQIFYWRGVEDESWWNDFAREITDYAQKYFPDKGPQLFLYNVNPNSDDFKFNPFPMHKWKPKKTSKHALVVVDDGEYYGLITHENLYMALLDWIDAEHERQYKQIPKSWKKGYSDKIPLHKLSSW
ncbi:hypothetical protein C5B42_05870 [Candidatus Cerribacteria bacterium 'Amazon FNV 2010 28 9']|uniref:Uncharacterized protein n=1 Tax=Candidatus Cerribacteria bacterium 'Amazon FNV 2010 28 9' TaxID=2081795 RepID=A0A317JM42_9BACT|nr:MAG: hypothetical protein C5B42_05870 [Candidatus Cerribacteria bacterium 'Amazon FNV 2010 28 9']